MAKKYNTTVDEIKKLNNLTSDTLSIGQKLKILTTTPSQELPSETYVVQKGDSLYSIARKFGTTVDSLKSINNLTSNLLSIGQVLRIPTSEKQTTYTVQKGDSLYSIAKKFNTSVDNLKALNNLSSNLLSIGQILVIE
ncbi:MAG: LysM peptidoglycan-binding domain-containing protein [Tenericutes bacterium]|nr:LysM peptidoglycan-binding domain-containing protein [Mycoplasmatota bacterium]